MLMLVNPSEHQDILDYKSKSFPTETHLACADGNIFTDEKLVLRMTKNGRTGNIFQQYEINVVMSSCILFETFNQPVKV